MRQFVIEREIPGAGALSEDQIREVSLRSLQALKEMGPQIQWVESYVTGDKVYCVYLAPDEDTVREHARKVGIPADRVAALMADEKVVGLVQLGQVAPAGDGVDTGVIRHADMLNCTLSWALTRRKNRRQTTVTKRT